MKVEFIHGTPSRPEFGAMFGGWLTEHGGRTFLIDCGVGSGGPTLVRRLQSRLGGRPLDYVLLTHIHLDHAGALGDLARAWPDLRVVAHQKGLAHLARPDRLWVSTQEVMGEVADVYGRPTPTERSRLISHTEAGIPGLHIIETPGHAPHHLSFRLGETMFVGEAGGCPYFHEGRLLSRPATPPRYFPEETLGSIERLLAEPDAGPAYFGHTAEALPFHEVLHRCRAQLLFWDELLQRPEAARRAGEGFREQLDRLADLVIREDFNYAPLTALAPPDLWRERCFLRNNIEGFLDHYRRQTLPHTGTHGA